MAAAHGALFLSVRCLVLVRGRGGQACHWLAHVRLFQGTRGIHGTCVMPPVLFFRAWRMTPLRVCEAPLAATTLPWSGARQERLFGPRHSVRVSKWSPRDQRGHWTWGTANFLYLKHAVTVPSGQLVFEGVYPRVPDFSCHNVTWQAPPPRSTTALTGWSR